MKAFLSHTSSDKDLVGLVHKKLANEDAWYDASDIENGEFINRTKEVDMRVYET